jgi:hypothetical protein
MDYKLSDEAWAWSRVSLRLVEGVLEAAKKHV